MPDELGMKGVAELWSRVSIIIYRGGVLKNHKMPQIRLNLDDEADKNVRVYMARKGIRKKEQAINEILRKMKV